MQWKEHGIVITSYIVLQFFHSLHIPFSTHAFAVYYSWKCMHGNLQFLPSLMLTKYKKNWQKSFLNFNWISCCMFHVDVFLHSSFSVVCCMLEVVEGSWEWHFNIIIVLTFFCFINFTSDITWRIMQGISTLKYLLLYLFKVMKWKLIKISRNKVPSVLKLLW